MAKGKTFVIPEGMDEETKDFIGAVISYLRKENKLNSIDYGVLRLLCTNYDLYVKASKLLAENGMVVTSSQGNVSVSPYYTVMKGAVSQIVDTAKEFGLTLRSRTKMNVLDSDGEDSPLAAFLKK